MGRRGIRGLKARVGREFSISSRRAILCSRSILVEDSEQGVTVLRVGRGAPEVRAAKSSEFG